MPDNNTSATGGYLQPTSSLPPDGASFDAIIQAVVVGITGLPGTNVIPRWQPEPPAAYPQNVDWCGVGEVSSDTQGNTYADYTAGEGETGTWQQSEADQVEVMASFYGPNCFANAKLLRAGLFVPQNREALRAAGLGFVGVDKISRVPDLVNNIWQDRADIVIVLNRVVSRTYNVLSVLSQLITATTSNGIAVTVTAQEGA